MPRAYLKTSFLWDNTSIRPLSQRRGSRGMLQKPNPQRNAQKLPPNLPQHEIPEPYARLLLLGYDEVPAVYDEVAAELNAGDVQGAASRLLAMVQDETW